MLNKSVQDEVASLEAGRSLAERLEAERLKVARELHDGPLQELIGIGFSVAELKRNLENLSTSEIQKKLQSIQTDSLEVARHLRDVVSELRPAGLQEFGVAQALTGFATKLVREYPGEPPELILNCEDLPNLTLANQLCLFRCAQEALNNALRHAKAEQVTVDLLQFEHSVELQVKDNGVGFRVVPGFAEFVQSKHFGLAGMAERVAVVSGILEVKSVLGSGTQVRVTIPKDEPCAL